MLHLRTTTTPVSLSSTHAGGACQCRHTQSMTCDVQRKFRSNVGVLPILVPVECYKSAGHADDSPSEVARRPLDLDSRHHVPATQA